VVGDLALQPKDTSSAMVLLRQGQMLFAQSRSHLTCPLHGLLALPCPQVSTQSGSLSQLPYPIPPVGADPNTWRPDEEPSPVNFNIKLPERLLIPATVRVGWWDASKLAWSEEGIR
jgi:hypothetical protein